MRGFIDGEYQDGELRGCTFIAGKRGITADTALRLARYFGTTSRFWMNMQASWELEVAEDQSGKAVEREVLPRTAA